MAKSDPRIFQHYDETLVSKDLQYIGESIRNELIQTEKTLLTISGEKYLLQYNPVVLRAVRLRIPFIYPLHLLQAEFLSQFRNQDEDKEINPIISEILMITIQGIAAGMQNTG